MKAFVLALFTSASLSPAAGITPHLPPAVAAGYTLSWHDEFDGDKLNAAEWNIRAGGRYAAMNQVANVYVGDGLLHLAVRKEKLGEFEYTAGGVISKREFKYGYYESRYRVPNGAGWHTSFWMLKKPAR